MRGKRLEPEDAARARAMLLLVLTAVFWSFGGILIKWVQWHPMAISGMRSAIGALTILAVFRRTRFTWSRDQVGCAVAYAGTVTLFVVATKLTTAANAILLQYTAPVHVALFGPWLLGEPSRRRDAVSIVVLLGGMSLFFLDQLSPAGFWGNIAALGSGVCFGWLTLLLRRQKGGSGIESILLGNLLAAAIGLPFMFGSMPDARGWVGTAPAGHRPDGNPVRPVLDGGPERPRRHGDPGPHDRAGAEPGLGPAAAGRIARPRWRWPAGRSSSGRSRRAASPIFPPSNAPGQ